MHAQFMAACPGSRGVWEYEVGGQDNLKASVPFPLYLPHNYWYLHSRMRPRSCAKRTEAGGQSQPRETLTWRTGCSIWVIVPMNKHMDLVLERRDTKCVKTSTDFKYLKREEGAKKLLSLHPASVCP